MFAELVPWARMQVFFALRLEIWRFKSVPSLPMWCVAKLRVYFWNFALPQVFVAFFLGPVIKCRYFVFISGLLTDFLRFISNYRCASVARSIISQNHWRNESVRKIISGPFHEKCTAWKRLSFLLETSSKTIAPTFMESKNTRLKIFFPFFVWKLLYTCILQVQLCILHFHFLRMEFRIGQMEKQLIKKKLHFKNFQIRNL